MLIEIIGFGSHVFVFRQFEAGRPSRSYRSIGSGSVAKL